MTNTLVVVSRQWRQPSIKAFISNKEVGAEMSLLSFLESMVEEMGSPAMVMTKTALLSKMVDASTVVLSEMKDKTKHVT